MSRHICPWWLTYTFDNPLRALFHNPAEILAPYVARGMTVADLGCGFGYFSIGLARMVAPNGRVIAVDIQQKMLEKARQRARKAGVDAIITFHQCSPDSLDMSQHTDFVLAFWMVHETGDTARFLRQVHTALKPGGIFLMVEPKFHVSEKSFGTQTRLAEEVGFVPIDFPEIRLSRAVAFRNGP